MSEEEISVILYDGDCGLCHRFIYYLISRDTHNRFRFAPLQSESGMKLLKDFPINELPDSVVVVFQGLFLTRSAAALHCLKRISGMQTAARILSLFPLMLSDRVYDLIARRRYRWFGMKENCPLPSPSVLKKLREQSL
jgi:predicted DCC family thiol-disulfide oxidoreductase YuxK